MTSFPPNEALTTAHTWVFAAWVSHCGCAQPGWVSWQAVDLALSAAPAGSICSSTNPARDRRWRESPTEPLLLPASPEAITECSTPPSHLVAAVSGANPQTFVGGVVPTSPASLLCSAHSSLLLFSCRSPMGFLCPLSRCLPAVCLCSRSQVVPQAWSLHGCPVSPPCCRDAQGGCCPPWPCASGLQESCQGLCRLQVPTAAAVPLLLSWSAGPAGGEEASANGAGTQRDEVKRFHGLKGSRL